MQLMGQWMRDAEKRVRSDAVSHLHLRFHPLLQPVGPAKKTPPVAGQQGKTRRWSCVAHLA